MKIVGVILIILLTLFGADYNDDDLDGVPNNIDRCPYTPFSDIVDEYGCSIEKLIRPKKLDYYFEYLYAKDNNFYENGYLFNLTIYKKRFDISITSLYFNNNYKRGFSDTNIKFEYLFNPNPMWDLYIGAGIDLPTYNREGNRIDYAFYINSEYFYIGQKIISGVYYIYTTDRYKNKNLKNSYGAYLGIEKFFKKYTFNLSYYYHKGSFGLNHHLLYLKAERFFKKGFYIFGTYSKGLDKQTIDSIFSVGFGKRF